MLQLSGRFITGKMENLLSALLYKMLMAVGVAPGAKDFSYKGCCEEMVMA